MNTCRIPSFLALLLICVAAAGAAPGIVRAAWYEPGSTLDPACAPTDADCGVATTTYATGLSYDSGTVSNTGLLSLMQEYGTPLTGALTLATSSAASHGLTVGLAITNASTTFTFAPTLSGTLDVGGGGTGLSSVTDGALLYGSGGGGTLNALATSTSGKVLQLDFATGRPVWVATSTLGLTAPSFLYPLVNAANTVSLAFGTTTANTWGNLNTFASGLLSLASTTIGDGTGTGGLTIFGNATTSASAYIGTALSVGGASPFALAAGSVFASALDFSASSTVSYLNGDLLLSDDNAGAFTLSQLVAKNAACSKSNSLISGGVVTYDGTGLVFDISPANYCINGLQYSTAAQQVTLAAADGTRDRIDNVVLTASSSATAITGIPASNPIAPSADPATQLSLTFVYVKAGASQPGASGTGPTTQIIYKEGAVGEWSGSSVGAVGTLSLAATNDPQQGTTNVRATSVGKPDTFQFATSTTFNPTGSQTLSFYLKNASAWSNNSDSILVSFLNASGTQLGVPVTIQNQSYGFDRTNASTYQKIAIPMSDFGTLGTTIKSLKFSILTNGSNTISFDLDNVVIQGTTQTATTSSFSSGTVNQGTLNRLAYYSGTTTVQSAGFLTIDTGNSFLGIGTTSPSQALSVAGNVLANAFSASSLSATSTFAGGLVVDSTSANTGRVGQLALTFGSGSGEGIASKRTSGGDQYGLDLYTSFQPRLTITNSGNVGINTQTPGSDVSMTNGLTINAGNSTAFTISKNGASALAVNVGQVVGGDVNFYDHASGNYIDDITLRSGNVGINTTGPRSKLDVWAGDINVTGNDTNGTAIVTTHSGNAYFANNTYTNGISINSSGTVTTSGAATITGLATISGGSIVLGAAQINTVTGVPSAGLPAGSISMRVDAPTIYLSQAPQNAIPHRVQEAVTSLTPNSYNVTFPNTPTVGNYLVAMIWQEGSAPTPNTGWTSVTTHSACGANDPYTAIVYHQVVNGDGKIEIPGTGGTAGMYGSAVIEVSGLDSSFTPSYVGTNFGCSDNLGGDNVVQISSTTPVNDTLAINFASLYLFSWPANGEGQMGFNSGWTNVVTSWDNRSNAPGGRWGVGSIAYPTAGSSITLIDTVTGYFNGNQTPGMTAALVLLKPGPNGAATTTGPVALSILDTVYSNGTTVASTTRSLNFTRGLSATSDAIGEVTVGLSTTTAGSIAGLTVGTTTGFAPLGVWGPDTASTSAALTIANAASTTAFQVFDDGHAVLAGSLTQNSDRRLKTNIASLDASSSLAAIESLDPVSFDWVDGIYGTGTQLGFIAQAVAQVFPQLVSTTSPTLHTPGGTLGLNYTGLIAPMIGSIKALAGEINAMAQSITTTLLDATTVKTKNLCVGDTCITEAQLKTILEETGQTASPASASNISSTTPADASSTDTGTTTSPDASSTPPEPDSTASSDATSSPETTPAADAPAATGPDQTTASDTPEAPASATDPAPTE